jgi:hypothetical protein
MNTPREIYEKFTNGDSLSDQDLTRGIAHFGRMAADLNASGPTFRLAAVEAHRVASTLADFKVARRG